MRGCLLKCAEWLVAELSKTLATELLKSRQKADNVGTSTWNPSDNQLRNRWLTRPDVSQILGAVVRAPSVLAPIPGELMDTTMPETRPRQPESERGSEPVDRNVRPRLAPDQEVTGMVDVENSQSTAKALGDVVQTRDGAHVDNAPDAASPTTSPYPSTSASNHLTVLPVETEFDSKADNL